MADYPTPTNPGFWTQPQPNVGPATLLEPPDVPTAPTNPALGGYRPYSARGGSGILNWQARLQGGNTDASTREVQNEELVEERLRGLLNDNSRYLEESRLRGREESSARGMLTSSYSAGASEREAIRAAQPIASQDAQWFGATAQQNMDAINQQRLADQQIYASLTGQEMGIMAQLEEGERQRSWQSGESERDRVWRSGESLADRIQQRDLQTFDQAFRAGQAQMDRDFQLQLTDINNTFQGTEAERQRMHQRIGFYYEQMFGQHGNLSNILAAIYNNPNLSASQQQAAAQNAIAQQHALWNTLAASFAQGVPEIFWQPYPYGGQAPAAMGPPLPTPIGGGGSGGGSSGGGGGGGGGGIGPVPGPPPWGLTPPGMPGLPYAPLPYTPGPT